MKIGQNTVAVKKGSVIVKIYPRNKGDRVYFQVADYSSGTRRLRNFSALTKAKEEAANIAEKISRGNAAALQLTNTDRDAYILALSHLRPIHVPLETAARNYAEACKILGGDEVLEAAKYYAKRNPIKLPSKTVQEVTEEFIEAKTS